MLVTVGLPGDAEPTGRVRLGGAVDQQRRNSFERERSRQIDGRRGLSYAALLIDDGKNAGLRGRLLAASRGGRIGLRGFSRLWSRFALESVYFGNVCGGLRNRVQ